MAKMTKVEELESILKEEISTIESIHYHFRDKDLDTLKRILIERNKIFGGLTLYYIFLDKEEKKYEKQHPEKENPYSVCKKALLDSIELTEAVLNNEANQHSQLFP